MEIGHLEEMLIRQAKQNGKSIPDKIKNKPMLYLGLQLYYNMFFDLECDREMGMAIGFIKWQTIENYCHSHSFNERQKELAHFFIRKMDSWYVNYFNAKGKANEK